MPVKLEPHFLEKKISMIFFKISDIKEVPCPYKLHMLDLAPELGKGVREKTNNFHAGGLAPKLIPRPPCPPEL